MNETNVSARGGGEDFMIGRYRVVERLGFGGFSIVYRAVDEALEADVAVKVLADNYSLDPEIRRRFLDEGRLLRKVQHPSLIQVHDVGETASLQPYLVLQYAAGGSLASRVSQRRRAGVNASRSDLECLVEALVGGLDALHQGGIVHRDVSPANVLITDSQSSLDTDNHLSLDDVGDGDPATRALLDPGEQFVLGDFGLAKDLRASSGLTVGGGTMAFAAPEQRGPNTVVSPRADVYGASAVVRFMAEGSVWAEAVDRGTERGLSTAPEDRPATMDAWGAELLAALDGNRGAPAARSSAPSTDRSTALSVGTAMSVGVALLVISGLIGLASWLGGETATGTEFASGEQSILVYGEGGRSSKWADQSWGFTTPLGSDDMIELAPSGALSFVADDPVRVPTGYAVSGELDSTPDRAPNLSPDLSLRVNDAEGEPLTSCLLAGSEGLVTVDGGRVRFVVPLTALGVADGSLSRISLQDSSGESVGLTLHRLAIEEAVVSDRARCG